MYKKHKRDCSNQKQGFHLRSKTKQDSQENSSKPETESEPTSVLPTLPPLPANTTSTGTLANAVMSLSLQPSKDLGSCGTYKVKLERGVVLAKQPDNKKKENFNYSQSNQKMTDEAQTKSSKTSNINNSAREDQFTDSSNGSSSQSSSNAHLSAVLQSSSNLNIVDLKNRSQKVPQTQVKRNQ